MTAGNPRDLLRDHGEPQRATYVELFFDVIFVFALTRLSHTLFSDLTWLGALHTGILLAAFWWVWVFTAWTTNRLNPAQPAIQFVIIPIMLGTPIMAGAVPEAFAGDGMIFAAAYVLIQVGRALFVTVAMHGQEVTIGSLQQFLTWSAVILCGPAIYLAGRARLDYLSFSRVALSRVIGLLLLVALAPVVAFLPPILIAVVAVVILTGIAVTDAVSWKVRPSEPTPPPPPSGREPRP
ncbi:low temperature requirement protein A [Micromonospora sp. NPDC047620]|uniref:low temperature requirement protein A n=1 Tax=Micromonospora sp. NPDC047620 TaxID=3364251 RepID=UPI003721A793